VQLLIYKLTAKNYDYTDSEIGSQNCDATDSKISSQIMSLSI
jgi:hypothetical protein